MWRSSTPPASAAAKAAGRVPRPPQPRLRSAPRPGGGIGQTRWPQKPLALVAVRVRVPPRVLERHLAAAAPAGAPALVDRLLAAAERLRKPLAQLARRLAGRPGRRAGHLGAAAFWPVGEPREHEGEDQEQDAEAGDDGDGHGRRSTRPAAAAVT